MNNSRKLFSISVVVTVISFIVILLLGLTSAKAEDSYTLYKSPKGRKVTVSGQDYWGYTLSEYKQLLTVDAELKSAEAQLHVMSEDVLRLKLDISTMRTIAALDRKEINLLNIDLLRKDALLVKTTKEAIKMHDQLTWRKRLLRVGGPILGALVAGALIGLTVK